jgi:hypothetical protein
MTNIPIKKYRVRRARKHGIDDRALAVQAFITRGNLEELITSNGLPREIDFLSLDVDGNDYWLWETLECVSPRVAVSIEGLRRLTPGEAFRPHANWLGRGISEAEQLAIMRELPYEEV